MKKSYQQRGFTLIELLVVIAIIGILSSIVLASLNTARQKARDARRLSDLKQIQLALELYYDAHSAYPPTLATSSLVTPGYISTIPTDPSNHHSYDYAALTNGSGTTCTSYHLGASLETTDNSALSSAAGAAASSNICSGSATDFTGYSSSNPQPCSSSDAGTVCYDVTP